MYLSKDNMHNTYHFSQYSNIVFEPIRVFIIHVDRISIREENIFNDVFFGINKK